MEALLADRSHTILFLMQRIRRSPTEGHSHSLECGFARDAVMLRCPKHESDFSCRDNTGASMGRLSLAKGQGEGEGGVKATNAAARQIQPLTFILSPSARGEATRPPFVKMMSLAAKPNSSTCVCTEFAP
jgi:hypothetical protein